MRIHIGKRVPKGFVELPGAVHMGKGIWMFRIEPTKTPWKMPKWMKKYRALICNTGGNDIESMVNGNADPVINLPLSTLQACVKSQVILLESLYEAGKLK